MSEVQIAIIDQENTQIALAVPGVQGPAGAISSGGSANQVFYKVSGTNYDAGWTFIGNANVDAAAAIAGTKISPNFGSQTVATTGVFSHALGSQGAPTITFTGDTNTGIYSPGADQLAISTNGVQRLSVAANGDVAFSNSIDLPNINTFIKGGGHNVVQVDATRTYVYGGTNGVQIRTADNVSPLLDITNAGLVGIGTSSPSSALDVSGAISLGAVALPSAGTARIFSRNTDSNLYIQTGSGNTLNFLDGSQNTMASFGSSTVTLQTGNSPRLSIDSSGRVGIGTTPATALHVSSADTELRVQSTNSTNGFVRFVNTSGSMSIGMSGAATNSLLTYDRTNNQNVHEYLGGASGYHIWYQNGSEAARIDSSRRLLVGTSTSRVVEDFGGNGPQGLIQIEATNSDAIMSIISAGTADAGRAGTLSLGRHRNSTVGGTPTIVQNDDTLGAICFAGGDGTDMRTKGASIAAQVDGTPGANDMPGRLVFSTTADGASSPTERMRISNNGQLNLFVTNIDGFQVRNSLAAGPSHANFVGRFSATDTLSGTVSYLVYTNGNVQNTNNSYGALSDIKLKENIVDANSQWDDIKALQVRNYNLKEGQTHRQIGLIAQEVDPISPGLVYESPDRDEDGNDLGTVTKSVNYSVLYMKAVKALQEAMERIETLEAKVAALESA